jgi:hypothetical protein
MKLTDLLEFAQGDGSTPGLKLIHTNTGKEVAVGDEVTNFRGEKAIVTGWSKPKSAASSGHISVRGVDDPKDDEGRQYYASVFDCEWINRTDRG